MTTTGEQTMETYFNTFDSEMAYRREQLEAGLAAGRRTRRRHERTDHSAPAQQRARGRGLLARTFVRTGLTHGA